MTSQILKKSFSSEFCEQLQKRIQKNQNSRRYFCGIGKCKRKFKEIANLLLHKRSHKPFTEYISVQRLTSKYRKRQYYTRCIKMTKWRDKPDGSFDETSELKSGKSRRNKDLFERDSDSTVHENSLISHNRKNIQLVNNECNSALKSPVLITSPNQCQDSIKGQKFSSEPNKEQFCYNNINEQHNQSTVVYKMFDNSRMENSGSSDYHEMSFEGRSNKITNDVKHIDHLFNCRFCRALFETEPLLIEHEAIHLSANEQEASHMSVNGEEVTPMSVSRREVIHNSANELEDIHINVENNERYYPSTTTSIYPTISSGYQNSSRKTSMFNCDHCNISFGSAKYLKEHTSLVHRQRRVNTVPLDIRITSAFSIQRENGSADAEINQRGQWNDGVLVLDSYNDNGQGFAGSENSASETALGRVNGEFCKEYGDRSISMEVNKLGGNGTVNGSSIGAYKLGGNGTVNGSSIGASNLRFSPSKPAEETSIFKCRICSIEFKELEGLKLHAKCHLRPAGYQCSICKRKFTKKWNLDAHVRSRHTKERPYECKVCGDRFIMKHHLKRHAETHDKNA